MNYKFKYDIYIDQGTTFNLSLTPLQDNQNPIDLTNSTGLSQIRKDWYSSNSVSINVSIISNTINLYIDANTTASMYDGKYVYDILIKNSNNQIYKLYEGLATVIPTSTKES